MTKKITLCNKGCLILPCPFSYLLHFFLKLASYTWKNLKSGEVENHTLLGELADYKKIFYL